MCVSVSVYTVCAWSCYMGDCEFGSRLQSMLYQHIGVDHFTRLCFGVEELN